MRCIERKNQIRRTNINKKPKRESRSTAYLLRLNSAVVIYGRHLAVHRRLGLAIGRLRLWGDLPCVHSGRLAVVGLSAQGMAGHRVVGRGHWVLVVWRAGVHRASGPCWRHACRGLTRLPLGVRSCFLARYDVDEEVKHVRLGEGGRDIGALQCSPLVLLSVYPCAHGQLGDEDVAALGEEDGCFGGDHLDFWVCLHDLLDACQGKLVELVIMGVAFEVVDGLLPVCGENVLVLTVQALVNVRPGPCVQLGGRITLCRQLGWRAEVSDCWILLDGSGWARRAKQTAALAPVVCRNVSIGVVAWCWGSGLCSLP